MPRLSSATIPTKAANLHDRVDQRSPDSIAPGADAAKPASLGREVVGVDLIRFSAALLVMVYHFGFWHWMPAAQMFSRMFPPRAPIAPALNFGWVGVEIFFVISGFVIAFSAEGATARRFLRSRVLRLVPGVWVCGTVALVLYALVLHRGLADRLWAYLCSLLFIPIAYIDDVYWTLSIEIVFYALVFALIRKGLLDRLETIMSVIGVLSGMFWIAALTLQIGLDQAVGPLGFLHMLVLKAQGSRYLQLLLVQHGCLFALGVVFYASCSHGLTAWRIAKIAALTAFCILEIIGQNGIITRAAGLDLPPTPAIAAWLIAMAAIAFSIRHNQALIRWLGPVASQCRFIGKMTYPLYLIHNSVGLSVVALTAASLGVWAIALALVAAVAAAGFIQAFAEPWVRSNLSHVIDRRLSADPLTKLREDLI